VVEDEACSGKVGTARRSPYREYVVYVIVLAGKQDDIIGYELAFGTELDPGLHWSLLQN